MAKLMKSERVIDESAKWNADFSTMKKISGIGLQTVSQKWSVT